jgi:RNA polymerase sigma factor (sigma-70 family)
MTRLALSRMDDPTAAPSLSPQGDPRGVYEEVLERAMRCASRFVSREQAFEVAHDVAVEMLHRPSARLSATLIYMRVTSRLLNLRRASDRRASLDGAYVMLRSLAGSWAQPGADLEADELQARIDAAVAAMPPAMRRVFLLIREEELSYKEAASRLGVSVNTVHTQLARANVVLRDCVKQYEADAPGASPYRSREGR